MKLKFYRQDFFLKYSYIKFHETPCGRKDGQTADLTKLIVALRNFGNTPHNLQKLI